MSSANASPRPPCNCFANCNRSPVGHGSLCLIIQVINATRWLVTRSSTISSRQPTGSHGAWTHVLGYSDTAQRGTVAKRSGSFEYSAKPIHSEVQGNTKSIRYVRDVMRRFFRFITGRKKLKVRGIRYEARSRERSTPTPCLFEPAQRPDDRANYCLDCSSLP